MKRRDLLKSIFGATVIATIPKPVMNRIEGLTEPIKINKPTSLKTVQKTITESKDSFFYLFNKDKLIAYGYEFNIEFMRDYSNYHFIDSEKTFFPTSYSWHVEGNAYWEDVKEAEIYFINGIPLKILIKNNNIKFAGDVYIQEVSIESTSHKIVLLGGGKIGINDFEV